MSLVKLREVCVDAFPQSSMRLQIMQGLEAFVEHLKSLGVRGELWVNGSFVTEKPDPNDSDLLIRLSNDFVEGASPELYEELKSMEDDDNVKQGLKQRYFCDFHTQIDYPKGHAQYWFSEYMYNYWMNLYGWNRDQCEMKGIAVIEL